MKHKGRLICTSGAAQGNLSGPMPPWALPELQRGTRVPRQTQTMKSQINQVVISFPCDLITSPSIPSLRHHHKISRDHLSRPHSFRQGGQRLQPSRVSVLMRVSGPQQLIDIVVAPVSVITGRRRPLALVIAGVRSRRTTAVTRTPSAGPSPLTSGSGSIRVTV